MDDNTTLVVALGSRLRARRAARRPEQDARHAARQRAVPPASRASSTSTAHRVKPRTRLDKPTILDIAPTVLALERPGAGAGHAGAGAERGARRRGAGRRVATLRDRRRAGRPRTRARRPRETSRGRIRRSSKNARRASATSGMPARRREIATSPRMHFEAGQLRGGGRRPTSGCSRRLNRTTARCAPASRAPWERWGATTRRSRSWTRRSELEPLNLEAYHNRAVIHERQGDRDAAIARLPDGAALQPATTSRRGRRSLRLGAGSPPSRPARPSGDRGGWRSPKQAGRAARRGDYAGAMQLLDEATRLAPALRPRLSVPAPTWPTCRATRAGAIARSEKGLAIEPDNALFREQPRSGFASRSGSRMPHRQAADRSDSLTAARSSPWRRVRRLRLGRLPDDLRGRQRRAGHRRRRAGHPAPVGLPALRAARQALDAPRSRSARSRFRMSLFSAACAARRPAGLLYRLCREARLRPVGRGRSRPCSSPSPRASGARPTSSGSTR